MWEFVERFPPALTDSTAAVASAAEMATSSTVSSDPAPREGLTPSKAARRVWLPTVFFMSFTHTARGKRNHFGFIFFKEIRKMAGRDIFPNTDLD